MRSTNVSTAESDETNDAQIIFVKSATKFHALNVQEINWVFNEGKYCILNCSNDFGEFTIKSSLSKVQSYLPQNVFIKTHRNYLINQLKIESYIPSGKVIINDKEIPVTRKYKKMLEKKLKLLPY